LVDEDPFIEPFGLQGPQNSPTRCENGTVGPGADCIKSRQTETLPNGVAHSILSITDNGPGDNTRVFTVPQGQFFFMGDNRDNSNDSRFAQTARGVGFVPYEDLIGRADRIMFSSAGTSMLKFWTWRSDRYFKAIE
jgi:signal peptidase I